MLPTNTPYYTPLSNDPPEHRSPWQVLVAFKRRTVTILLCGLSGLFVWRLLLMHPSGPLLHRKVQVVHDKEQQPLPPFEPEEVIPAVDWAARAEQVKQAFLHAYHGYEEFASPHDELLPLSNKSVDNFDGWGVTAIDALDTMYLMGLHDEFQRGVELVDKLTFSLPNRTYAPFFETTIRYLGGLLSAYALSHDLVLLNRAEQLGKALLPVFNTTSGYPTFSVNTVTGSVQQPRSWLLFAEIASCQMEYKYLAHVTGKRVYYEVAEKITTRLHATNTTHLGGMFPLLWDLIDGEPADDRVTIGGMADSGYEYLLKQWLLSSGTEAKSLELYLRTANGVIENLLYLSPTRKLLYVTDVHMVNGTPTAPSRRFEHLSCFLPGLLQLGAHTLPLHAMSPQTRQLHMWAASGLAHSCWLMYADQPTGLGPEGVSFMSAYELERERLKMGRVSTSTSASMRTAREAKGAEETEGVVVDEEPQRAGPEAPKPEPGRHHGRRQAALPEVVVNQTEWDEKMRWANALRLWGEDGAVGEPPGLAQGPAVPMGSPDRDYYINGKDYRLRPETLESFYIMWRTTGDVQWRERGWTIFQALENETKTSVGYASIWNVEESPAVQQDSMPSYFLAETLKYLYLLFLEDDPVPLDQWVFNTEAHPLPVFQWSNWEKKKFGVL